MRQIVNEGNGNRRYIILDDEALNAFLAIDDSEDELYIHIVEGGSLSDYEEEVKIMCETLEDDIPLEFVQEIVEDVELSDLVESYFVNTVVNII